MSADNARQDMPRGQDLVVLYEDADLAAVEKPAGIHTAPLSRDPTGTLLGAIIERWPGIAELPGRKPVEPGLLHRLDRGTSGIVIVARTEAAFHALARAFEEGGVKKEYTALCLLLSPESQPSPLSIVSRFAPYGPGRRMVRVIREEDMGRPGAREATRELYATDARILERRGGMALVRALISRGFRHQVRAHLSALGLPIVGDPLYGAEPAQSGEPAPRMFLHACRIVLQSPTTGQEMEIVSPVPAEFGAALARG